ncbi:MAG: hypothetical protein ACTSRK_02920 [Promethearchaeota archaeon]
MCKKCAQLGLCRDHYAELSQDQITNLKLVNKRYLNSVVLGIAIWVTVGVFELLVSRDRAGMFDEPYEEFIFRTIMAIVTFPLIFIVVRRKQKMINEILLPRTN